MTDQEFQSIYDRQAEHMYKVCCFYLQNAADAQDAVQNIFLKLYEKQITFRDSQHEKAWFYTVAKNHCTDILRSGWRKKQTVAAVLPEQAEHEMEPVENLYLEQALRKLPVKQKEVLYLYYYEEYSVREISAIVKRRESTIQTQLAAGRKKLKKYLMKERRLYEAE